METGTHFNKRGVNPKSLMSRKTINNKKMKTKKSTLSILFCGLLLLATSCGTKNDPAQTTPDAVQKEIITQIFGAGSGASGLSLVSPAKSIATKNLFKSPASAATSIPIPTTTTDGPNGGTLTISGNLDMTSTSADAATMTMTMSEVFSGFGIIAESKTYTMSGTIQYSGNYVISSSKITGKFTTSGSLTVVGSGYNKQMAIDLTETMSATMNSSQQATSTTITVTGTIAGQTINYTVTQ